MTHQICIEQKTEHNSEQMFGKLLTNQNVCSIIVLVNEKQPVLGTGIPIMHQLFSTKDHITKKIAIRHYYFTYFIQHCQSFGNYW